MRFEADVLPGLESVLLTEFPGGRVFGPGRIGFEAEKPAPLLYHRAALGIYAVLEFDVPRPKALLGQQHFDRLVKEARAILARHPRGSFRTLRLSAAGDDSPVMERLKAELAKALGLSIDKEKTDDADFLLRLRPAGKSGWEALLSLTPRPLSTRRWRVCDMPGAMNATLAHAMALLTGPQPTDAVLNLCCGSGTLLIERSFLSRAASLVGCDTNPAALDAARANVEAAELGEKIRLEDWDATELPLPDASVDVILADLPFGQRIGSHIGNVALYPAVFAEAARVAAPGARLCVVTHELKLAERSLGPWRLTRCLQVAVGGMHPKVFVASC
jgi:SAM-dependent methyltransferase